MGAPEGPASKEQPPRWLQRTLRFAVASLLILAMGGFSVTLAWIWSPPHPDAAEQARVGLRRAFEHRQAPARELNSERWTALFAFGPLTTQETIRAGIGHRELNTEIARVGPHERLLVFADEEEVVASARLGRGFSEIACIAAGRSDGVPPGMPIRIESLMLENRQVLVAVAESVTPESIRRCLRDIPSF